ncbi:hypothetical protein LMH87_002959 [Akanthomyces muscarius]|uniref:Zn(2)-C6 fungal-type domain-containing protein n=1 Tax=Akanthomyces muscarius TaxID=2231603 RepID=A0A9W8UK65_AKAMU|nr:hypothetical protein LMH87_002959 [Akanthomyces muscarius]KAJ4148493.1 hypothetical protein LMH87_002959 [Akanthomyces muscarius]
MNELLRDKGFCVLFGDSSSHTAGLIFSPPTQTTLGRRNPPLCQMAKSNSRNPGGTPPVGAVEDSKRVKRWAPRAKTGCVTCRRRKVRCDEAKPICGNCVATRRYCGGPYYQDSAQATEIIKTMAVVIPRLRETAPKRWDVVEAFEYLGLYAIPHSTEMDVMALRPAKCIELYGCRAVNVLRSALARYMELETYEGNFLEYLLKKRLFERICDLMEAEHILCLDGWRAHFDGYFALLIMFGIPKNIPKDNPVFVDMLRSMTVNAIVGNSVCRVDKQLRKIYEFDDTELVNLFGETCFVPFPCPKAIFAEIAAINRLRLIASTCKISAILPEANAIFGRINSFDPETWKDTADFEIPDTPEVVLVAKIFQLAVSLYGILALGLEHADASAPNWPDKITTTAEMIMLMQKTLKSPKCVAVMTWPSAVAGVAVADGPDASRNLILDILVRIDSDVLAYGIAAHTIERLQTFWLTKKTGWEDCWNDFYLLW